MTRTAPEHGDVLALVAVILSAALAYVPIAALAAAPVGLLVLVCLWRPGLRARARARTALLPPLLLLSAAGVASAVALPSVSGQPVVRTTIDFSVLGCALALMPGTRVVTAGLAIVTAVAAGMLAWAWLVSPASLVGKSPLPVGPRAPALGGLGGGMVHLNGAGVAGAVAAAGWIGTSAAAATRRGRALSASLAAVAVAVVIASGSRTAGIGVAGGAAAVLVLAVARRHPRIAWGMAGAMALAAVAALASPVTRAAIASLPDMGSRLGAWRGTLAGIAQAPLQGRGIGSFPLAYVNQAAAVDPTGGHDTWLQVWLELGLAGLAAVVWATVRACAGLRAPLRRAGPEALAVAGMLAAWLIVSAFESTIVVGWRTGDWAAPWQGWNSTVMPLAFALWGLAGNVADRG